MNHEPPIPPNEPKRLNAFKDYNIDDTIAVERLDRLARIASLACQTPAASVNFVEEDQLYLAGKVGIDVAGIQRKTSFCQYTIMGTETFVVEDTKDDERFTDYPIVNNTPGIRFYAGHPLVDPKGYALGTLCVMDYMPRKLAINEESALKTLAEEAVHTLLLRKEKAALLKEKAILKRDKETWNKFFDISLDLFCIASPDGHFLKVNKAWEQVLGYKTKEIEGQPYLSFIHPDDTKKTIAAVEHQRSGGKIFGFVNRYRAKHGDYKHLEWQSIYVNNIMYGAARDVTERKKAEEKLKETLSKLNGILEASTQVSIICTDLDGIITTFNSGAENMLGYNRSEVIGIDTPLILHLENEINEKAKELGQALNKKIDGSEVFLELVQSGKHEAREWTYLRKNGTHCPVLLTITAIKENDNVTGYLGVAVDITEIKNAENEIKSILTITKDQNERLKNFAHIVGHNLKSHSGNLTTLLDMLEQENTEKIKKEIALHLRHASINLKDTIDNLQEVVNLDAATGENLTSVSLLDSVNATINNLTTQIKNTGTKIMVDVDPNVKVLGLLAYIDSIILNFITNAIKYRSPKRQNTIQLSTLEDQHFTTLVIKDNGLGINLEKHGNELFGMYKTFHKNKDARGIGLFITKNQVDALGGKIEVESQVNEGTTFKISFQRAKT